ncbi:MAG: hypothetical protein WBA43_01690 [Elainellaceae cyanobacterium]|jgi:hypothetical protein
MLVNIQHELSRQRVKHIVNSYRLDGQEPFQFNAYLHDLFDAYQAPLIELALIETLVDCWASVPLVRGTDFLRRAHTMLHSWDEQPIISTLTPEQFSQISGLDPTPVYGSGDRPNSRPIAHS